MRMVCYSICYSLYGPRVSADNVSYKINPNSALITDFCNLKESGKILVNVQHGKYVVQPISTALKFKNYTSAVCLSVLSFTKSV